MLIPLLAALSFAGGPDSAHMSLQTLLQAKDQALLDAFAPGDRALWANTLTSDAVYVDENGTIMGRDEFLDTIKPLPPGTSGQIAIKNYQFLRHGDTALVVHTDDEHENYHGQMLHLTSLTTETWILQSGDWKLALVHAYVKLQDPPALTVSLGLLQAYVGRYQAAPDLTYVISMAGDHLLAGREGKLAAPILVESGDVLFVPGQPRTRRIFQRDPSGRVVGFVERRESEDLIWKRVSDH